MISSLKLFPRVFALMWRANGWRLVAALILNLVGAMSGPLQIWISAVVIDRIATLATANVAQRGDIYTLLPSLIGFAVIWAIGQIAGSVSQGINEVMAGRTEYVATTDCIEKANTFDLAFFDSGKLTGKLEMVRQQVWRLHSSVMMLNTIVGQTVSSITLLALLVSISPIIPIVLCLVVLPRVLVRSYYANRIYSHYTGNIESEQLGYHVAWLLTNTYAAKDVRLFGLSDYLLGRYRHYRETLLKLTQTVIWQRERAMMPVSVLSVLGTIAAWGIALAQAFAGAISVGGLAAVFQSVQQLGQTFDGLFEQLGYLYGNKPYIAEYFEFLDARPETIAGALTTPQDAADKVAMPQPILRGLRFEKVSFRYPEADKPVLADISFELRPGECIAIVGENGAGKSTLSKLILHLYDPSSGAVFLDDVDLRCYDKQAYYEQVSAVFQDYPHINLSARENIGVGNIAKLNDEARIRRAAELGGATVVIDQLKDGLDTMLGKTLERGVDLSGGQWQRLALARAFMRDAQVLVLDEPSAALDPLAEQDIYQRFAQLVAGKMSVLISHRLASCKMADRILVLEHGRVIESGNHDALMARGGRYAVMFKAQADQYQVAPNGTLIAEED